MSVLTAQQTLREGLPAPDEVIPTSPDRGKPEPPAIYPLGVSHYMPLSHPGRGLPRPDTALCGATCRWEEYQTRLLGT